MSTDRPTEDPELTAKERETFEKLRDDVDDEKVKELCDLVLQSSDNEDANS